jgi:4-hydroxy-3-methylbut-2-enyl diphosphate reductase
LREVAQAHGVDAYLINGPDELDSSWLEGVENVGITSGASTPESMVQAVIESLGADEVERIDGDDEDVSFVLPAQLRE